ncbi:MAG: pilus assembly PilX N-terminal domain-containing protein [Patescibacteria group bacterium]
MTKIIKQLLNKIKVNKRGSALALTMFILAGMMIVAISGSYIVVLGIKSAGVQSQSTRAYFAAESGAEKVLWEMRKNSWAYSDQPVSLENSITEFDKTLNFGASYKIYYTHKVKPILFNSVGAYNKTKRSIQLSM